MNRHQARAAKHNKNPYAAAQARFERELREALKKEGVQLITASTGHDDAGTPTWVLQVKRDVQTWLLSAPNKAIPYMVKAILARMNGETDEIETAQAVVTTASTEQTAPPAITADAPVQTAEARHVRETDAFAQSMPFKNNVATPVERVEKAEEDLSRYLK